MSTDATAPSSADLKRAAARAALAYIEPGSILGVGTGSTVDALIGLLGSEGWAARLRGTVSSSERSSAALRAAGFAVMDLNELDALPLYIDGADEATRARHLIKGGGAALTREKIVAAVAERFVCIVDESKLVGRLGRFPLPIEVIPMARRHVERRVRALGGDPVWRQSVVTDNGNHILDVHGLSIEDALGWERTLQQIVGVVCVGLFAARGADVLVVASGRGISTL